MTEGIAAAAGRGAVGRRVSCLLGVRPDIRPFCEPADWTGMVLPHPRQNAVRMKHVLAEKRRELRPRSHLVVTHGTALGEIRERHDVHHIFDCLCRARRGRRGLGVINAHGVEVKRHDNILHLAAFTRRTQRAAGGGLLFRRRPVKIMRSKALDKLIW